MSDIHTLQARHRKLCVEEEKRAGETPPASPLEEATASKEELLEGQRRVLCWLRSKKSPSSVREIAEGILTEEELAERTGQAIGRIDNAGLRHVRNWLRRLQSLGLVRKVGQRQGVRYRSVKKG